MNFGLWFFNFDKQNSWNKAVTKLQPTYEKKNFEDLSVFLDTIHTQEPGKNGDKNFLK